MLGKKRIDTQFITMCQRRSIMTGIQNQVGLFQSKRISSCIRPLFQHLVAYTPHDNARMVTVTLYQIGEIALMPFIKKTCIIAI